MLENDNQKGQERKQLALNGKERHGEEECKGKVKKGHCATNARFTAETSDNRRQGQQRQEITWKGKEGK